jgi:hypothetical protein
MSFTTSDLKLLKAMRNTYGNKKGDNLFSKEKNKMACKKKKKKKK